MMSFCEPQIIYEFLGGIIRPALTAASKFVANSPKLTAIKNTVSPMMNNAKDFVSPAIDKSKAFLDAHPLTNEFVRGAVDPKFLAIGGAITVGADQLLNKDPEYNIKEVPLDPNRPFAGISDMARQYSEFTDQNPILGYGVVPTLALGSIAGTGYLGKKIFSKKS